MAAAAFFPSHLRSRSYSMVNNKSQNLSSIKLFVLVSAVCVYIISLASAQPPPPPPPQPPLPISFDRELTQYPIAEDTLYPRNIASGSRRQMMSDAGGNEDEEITGGDGGPDKEILFDMKPFRDFDRFDPRSPHSFFEFNTVFDTKLPRLDNGIFLRDKKSLQLSTWFNRYFPPDTPGGDAALVKYEFCIETKKPISIKHDQKLVARSRFTADSLNLLPHPYPDELVVNPYDDMRLAASHFFIADKTETGIVFHLFATEQGIWGGYFRILFAPIRQQQGYRAFQILRKLGDRPGRHAHKLKGRYFGSGFQQFTLSSYPYRKHESKDMSNDLQMRNLFGGAMPYGGHEDEDDYHHHHTDWIDATIEYDRKHGVARYYLGDNLVWTIDRIGMIKQSDDDGRNRLVAHAPGIESIVSPRKFWFFPGCNSHQVDLADPNKDLPLRENIALTRAVGARDYYGPEMMFWDDMGARNNSFYGQGVVMTLDWFRVTRRKSD